MAGSEDGILNVSKQKKASEAPRETDHLEVDCFVNI